MRIALRERSTPEPPEPVDTLDRPDVPSQETRRRASNDRFGWWLLLICAVAFILRLAIIYQGRHNALSGDGFQYSSQANLNATGHWFVQIYNTARRPDALHPPAWTLLLTVWAWLGQHSWLSQQVLATTVGSLTVGAVGLAGRRIGGVRVGLIAAGIAAVYPGLWVYERALLSETLLLLGIAVTILLAYRFRARPSAGLAAVLGIMCGLVALTRSEQILVFAFVVVPLILAVKHVALRRRIGWLALAALCALAVLTPWTVYNLGRFQRPVLLSNNFGSAVLQGNCNITYHGPYTGYYSTSCLSPTPRYQDESLQNSLDLHEGLTYLENHVTQLPVVLFAREGRTFGFWAPFQQVHLDAQWEGNSNGPFGASYVPTAVWVYRLALFGFWLLLIPALVGVIVLRRRKIPVYPLLGFFAIVALTVAATYGEPRYRAAVEVPLVLLAAVGISATLAYKRPAQPPRGRGVAQPETSLAATTDDGNRLANPEAPRRVADRIPVRALAVVALVISLVVVGAELNVADAVPAQDRMVLPMNGATVAGRVLLFAAALPGATKQEFRVTGGEMRNTVVATGKLTQLGWYGYWNTSAVAPGRYRIWSVTYVGATTIPSSAINVTIRSGTR